MEKKKILPLILLFLVILLDQISKCLIVEYVPLHTVLTSFFGDFLRIILVYNTGVAFSLGAGWGDVARGFLFKVIPVIVLIFVMIFYFKTEDLNFLQRWAVCGIVGGGFGNIIDRIFRAEGVVDFIDIKFYGLFGFERWPTFNIADAAVVVCGILLVVTFIFSAKTSKSGGKK